jgi:hypothetical protein
MARFPGGEPATTSPESAPMEHGGDTDPGAEVLGIGGDGERGLGSGLEQDVVDHGLVLPGNVSDGDWQREDEVEVPDLEEIGLAFGQPLARRRALAFWAVSVAATLEGDDGVAPRCGNARSPTSPSTGRG